MIKDTLKVLSPHTENKILMMLFQNILRTEKSVSLCINVLYQIIRKGINVTSLLQLVRFH